MNITTFVFDLDGVICMPPFRFAKHLEEEFDLTLDDTREFFRGPFLDCLRGQRDLFEEIAPWLPKWGLQMSVEELLDRWFNEESVVDARMIAVVMRLERVGVRCVLGTNQEKHRGDFVRKEMGFDQFMSAVYLSADAGAMKPDTPFYAYVTDQLVIPRDEIMFVDDSAANVDAARTFGWRALHYTDFQDFKDWLDTTGLLPD